ncbi:MAG: MinD/ParA family protein [Nanoarchaeota archaeon]|nr:MinD/ParA family protein [Nanoarchaeota archaeon]
MPKTIGIISIKGGVGKTTIASSLASSLTSNFQKKVLLIDANYSAPNLGIHMDILSPESTIQEVLSNKSRMKSAIHNRFGVDVIPGSYMFQAQFNPLKLRDKINSIKNDYDFIILDSSPSLNEELLSTILASDNLFVVSTPDYPTLYCSLRAAKLAKQRGRPIAGIILNKVRDPSYELSLKEIESALEIPVVAKIPDDKSAARSLFLRMPIPIYKKHSKLSKEINRLGAALANKKEKRSILGLIMPNFKREQVNRQIMKENFYTSSFS